MISYQLSREDKKLRTQKLSLQVRWLQKELVSLANYLKELTQTLKTYILNYNNKINTFACTKSVLQKMSFLQLQYQHDYLIYFHKANVQKDFFNYLFNCL